MKKIVLLVAVVFTAVSLLAQPPKGPAKKGMTFGTKTTAEGAVAANELNTVLADKTTADVKIKGKVVEVCKAEGCWIRMETASGPMLIKMKDHSFTVPLALNGKTIVADGTAEVKETSVEMQKHYAEDAGKSKEEIEAIKEPKKEIVLQAKGILVL
jgi:ABC-type Na+ efflux pump permease subunit